MIGKSCNPTVFLTATCDWSIVVKNSFIPLYRDNRQCCREWVKRNYLNNFIFIYQIKHSACKKNVLMKSSPTLKSPQVSFVCCHLQFSEHTIAILQCFWLFFLYLYSIFEKLTIVTKIRVISISDILVSCLAGFIQASVPCLTVSSSSCTLQYLCCVCC